MIIGYDSFMYLVVLGKIFFMEGVSYFYYFFLMMYFLNEKKDFILKVLYFEFCFLIMVCCFFCIEGDNIIDVIEYWCE